MGLYQSLVSLQNRGVLMLNSGLHNKLKAEAERHQMLKTLLKVLCKGALWCLCLHSSAAGRCPALLCMAPLCLKQGRGLCLWAPSEPAAPGAAPAVAESLGECGRWMTLSHHGPLTNCNKSPHCKHKNAELTPPAADQNPVSTRQNPLLMKLACTLN